MLARLSRAHRTWVFGLQLRNGVHHDQFRFEFRREVARPHQRSVRPFGDRSHRSPCRSASTSAAKPFCKCAPVHTGTSTSCRTLAATEPEQKSAERPVPVGRHHDQVRLFADGRIRRYSRRDRRSRQSSGSRFRRDRPGDKHPVLVLACLSLQRRDPARIDRADKSPGVVTAGTSIGFTCSRTSPAPKCRARAAACWAAPAPCSEKSTGSRIFESFMTTGS